MRQYVCAAYPLAVLPRSSRFFFSQLSEGRLIRLMNFGEMTPQLVGCVVACNYRSFIYLRPYVERGSHFAGVGSERVSICYEN